MGLLAKARSARNHPAARGLPPVWLAAAPKIPIPSDTCSRFLLGNLERPGRVGARRRRALRAAPRAVFAVTAIRLQSLTPSRLRRCALRLPPGDRRKAHPRRAQLGAPVREPNRRCRIDQVSAPPQWSGRGGYVVACCGRLCGCVPSSTLAGPAHHVTKEGSRQFTFWPPGIAMELPHHASRPAPEGTAAALSPVVGWLTWLASASESVKPSCGNAGPARSPFGAVQPKASLSRCESWRWRGCASGFMAATVRRKQLPLRYAHSSR